MDLIKLMGSVSVSRNLFHLRPGMAVLNLQEYFYLQIISFCYSWLQVRSLTGDVSQLPKLELCIA